ncbi:MAG: radical SAM protein [Anaerolineaceae bacterium]|nr:radical SAM protein [Anaerolineaceae bacterium]
MNTLLNKLRLKWFLTRRTIGYTEDYVEHLYRIYLNHTKIIHFRDGYPVYSLSTPALFSPPAANFLARSLYRSIQNKNFPNLMSFAVNDVCDAACEHCSFFTGVDDATRTVMSVDQCRRVIRQALDLGVSVINFVGGEPLLRKDLLDIINSVDKRQATTVMFTNGSLLAERAAELHRAGLDSVYVSIDAASAERHDQFRGKPGLFEKAMKGIAAAKAAGMSVGLSCSISPESFAAGELDRLIELGKRIGIHEVLIFDTMPSGRYQHRTDLIDNTDWIEQMIDSLRPYNEDPSYPGVISFAYMTSHRSVGCSCGTSYFYVSPYGDIMSCDFNHAQFGNALDRPLYQIWDELSTRPDFQQAKWGGCKIKSSDFLGNGHHRSTNGISQTTNGKAG